MNAVEIVLLIALFPICAAIGQVIGFWLFFTMLEWKERRK